MSDLGAGGVKIGEQEIRADPSPSGRSATRSPIAGFTTAGNCFHSAVGVWIGQSADNVDRAQPDSRFLLHRHLDRLDVGLRPALATGNQVEWNHVHHLGALSDGDGPILSDMGGIYTLGNQRGTVIRNNLFHDIAGFRYGGWGIYFDEGTTDILAENNIVYRTTHGGFHQHYGKDNIVRNNIFAFGRDAPTPAHARRAAPRVSPSSATSFIGTRATCSPATGTAISSRCRRIFSGGRTGNRWSFPPGFSPAIR